MTSQSILSSKSITKRLNGPIDSAGNCQGWSGRSAIDYRTTSITPIDFEQLLNTDSSPRGIRFGSELVLAHGNSGALELLDHTWLLWNPLQFPDCSLEQLYQGPSIIIRSRRNSTYLLIDDLTAGAEIKSLTVICNIYLNKTSVPGVLYKQGLLGNHTVGSIPTHGRWSSHIAALADYQALSSQIQLDSTVRTVTINQCLLEQRLDLEVLLGSTHTPEESGLRFMGEPGWTVQRAGAVLKISKCAECLWRSTLN